MATFDKLNNVLDTSIETINGVAKAGVADVNGNALPGGGGANRANNQPDWAMGFARTSGGAGKYGYAYDTDRTSWTSADYKTTDRNGSQLISVGKNASGQGIFMIAQSLDAGGSGVAQNQQLAISGDDITDGTTWTNYSLQNSTLQRNCVTALQWSEASDDSAAGVWIAGTLNGKLFRSTNGGSTWSQLNESSNVPATWRYYGDGGSPTISNSNLEFTCVRDITSEGNGTWVIVQKDRMFKSTDDGLNWSEVAHGIDMGDYSNGGVNRRFFGIIYTNNSYVVAYRTNGNSSTQIRVRSAHKSDLTDWGSLAFTNSPRIDEPDFDDEFNRVRMVANSTGKVMFASFEREKVGILDVSGKTISNTSAVLINSDADGRIRDIATDGSGVWLISAENSDVWESTNDGSSWTRIVNGHPDDDTNLNCITSNAYLPIE